MWKDVKQKVLNVLQPVFAKLKSSLILCHVRYLRNILSLSLYHGKILEKCRKINAPLVSIFPTPVLSSPDLEKKVMQLFDLCTAVCYFLCQNNVK